MTDEVSVIMETHIAHFPTNKHACFYYLQGAKQYVCQILPKYVNYSINNNWLNYFL